MIITVAVAGLALGLALGFLVPWSIPAGHSNVFAVLLALSLDSVFGGIKAAIEGVFDDKILILGFVCNAILSAFLLYVGNNIGISLYYMALFAFGVRIFRNMGVLRQFILHKE